MSPRPGVPVLRQVVLDAPHARALAELSRHLLGLQHRPGDEDLATPTRAEPAQWAREPAVSSGTFPRRRRTV